MEIQFFLDSLRNKLGEFGVETAEADRYIKQFERYFNTLSDEEVEAQINGFDSVDGIARNIVNLIARKRSRAEEPFPDADLVAEATASFDAVKEGDADQNTQEYDSMPEEDGMPTEELPDTVPENDRPAVKKQLESQSPAFLEELDHMDGADTLDDFECDFLFMPGESDEEDLETASEPEPPAAEEPAPMEETLAFETVREDAAVSDAADADRVDETASPVTAASEKDAQADKQLSAQDTADLVLTVEDTGSVSAVPEEENAEKKQGGVAVAEATRVDIPAANPADTGQDQPLPEDFPFDENLFEEYIPNTGMFWGLLAASFPVWVPALVLVACLYGAAYIALGVAVAAFIAALVGVIIVGTGFSLIGLIYGITQLSVSKPVALYEMGLGLAVAGVALVLGVLLYNGAVRFMPWVIRRMNVFFHFSLRQFRKLVRRFKKACVRT